VVEEYFPRALAVAWSYRSLFTGDRGGNGEDETANGRS
jgi:hypothetical protein